MAGVGVLVAGVGGRLPPTLQPGCLSVPRDGTTLLLEALSLCARARDLTCLWLKPRPLKILVLEVQSELASRLSVALLPLLRESFAGTERVNTWTTLLGAGAELAGAQGCTAGAFGLCCFGTASSAPSKQPSSSTLLRGVTSGPRVHQEQDRDAPRPLLLPQAACSLTRLP